VIHIQSHAKRPSVAYANKARFSSSSPPRCPLIPNSIFQCPPAPAAQPLLRAPLRQKRQHPRRCSQPGWDNYFIIKVRHPDSCQLNYGNRVGLSFLSYRNLPNTASCMNNHRKELAKPIMRQPHPYSKLRVLTCAGWCASWLLGRRFLLKIRISACGSHFSFKPSSLFGQYLLRPRFLRLS
jgi:hypothetical protein